MPATIKINNAKKVAQSIGKKINGIADMVYCGYPEKDTVGYPKNPSVTVAQVAVWNEYGTARIPSRPFFRNAWKDFKNEGKGLIEQGINKVVAGKTGILSVMQMVATVFVGRVKESILSGSWQANATATIARKGSSKPLFDTGLLLQNCKWWRDAK